MPKYFRGLLSKQNRIILGVLIMIFSIALIIAFVSYLFTWHQDESIISEFVDRQVIAQNSLSKFGATISHFFIYQGFGLASFAFVYLFFFFGVYFFIGGSFTKLADRWFWGVLSMLWVSVFLSIFFGGKSLVSGIIGFEVYSFLVDYIGKTGLVLLLIFAFSVYAFLRLKMTPERIISFFKGGMFNKTFPMKEETVPPYEESDYDESKVSQKLEEDYQDDRLVSKEDNSDTFEVEIPQEEDLEVELQSHISENSESSNLSDKLVADYGKFDPTLELSDYKFPLLDFLEHYDSRAIKVDKEELEENKEKIVKTLLDYKIEIDKIKATVGPTVTLYEIIPSAGVRISKIKNLEDDIALSLSALGIRIIAPMPGKGTIGIEVPNKTPSMVSMRTVIASEKFQHSEKMALPLALGKTISNETFVVDLAKMPHLLIAGATGQGKSVGLNAILTSLIYKKHPAEVKFVLVDPKKVELTLFNKIERHFLAKMPDSEEGIITDNSKVINTLNSLCIEMDDRYELLKNATTRNIIEYNEKFKNRSLNPENGHRFLPYIVLIVDEFADLIMTAGKEVETPIARLAQLARAIGIHLIIATQRPSVNVITGIIKANFPARIAFRVTSKIDSRTILDSQGADQLIGRGDMLFTQGNELTRLQCAFVDTPEVEKITDFVGSQRAYPEAYLLPEYAGEEATNLDIDVSERDDRFREAAEVIVLAQQGSTSLIQRKLKLGYNRSGRIIDQLEAAGIVGPFEGSKARQVLVPDIVSLEKVLNSEENT